MSLPVDSVIVPPSAEPWQRRFAEAVRVSLKMLDTQAQVTEGNISLTTINNTVASAVGNIIVIYSMTEPEVPDTIALWVKTPDGGPTTISISGMHADGMGRGWVWLAELP